MRRRLSETTMSPTMPPQWLSHDARPEQMGAIASQMFTSTHMLKEALLAPVGVLREEHATSLQNSRVVSAETGTRWPRAASKPEAAALGLDLAATLPASGSGERSGLNSPVLNTLCQPLLQ